LANLLLWLTMIFDGAVVDATETAKWLARMAGRHPIGVVVGTTKAVKLRPARVG